MLGKRIFGRGRTLWAALLPLLVLGSQNPARAVPSVPAGSSSSLLTRQVIRELNRVRTDPRGYADYLETLRGYYGENHILRVPGEMAVRTQEGVSALDGAILALRSTLPVPPLNESRALAKSAGMLAGGQAQTGARGHYGPGGETPFTRMARCGTWETHAGENVAYGRHSAQRIVADLVIDDGVADRGHRRNILMADYRIAGASFNTHPRYGTVCVIDFAAAMSASPAGLLVGE